MDLTLKKKTKLRKLVSKSGRPVFYYNQYCINMLVEPFSRL